MRQFSLLTGLLVFFFTSASLASDRAKLNIMCKPTPQNLVYDCMIKLMMKKNGAPLEGATVMIKSDMPSMPMAHNIPTVHAVKGNKPGHYKARLKLQMHGDWALTIDIGGPLRDRIIKRLHFGGAMKMKH